MKTKIEKSRPLLYTVPVMKNDKSAPKKAGDAATSPQETKRPLLPLDKTRLALLGFSLLLILLVFHVQGNVVSMEHYGRSAFRWMMGRWRDKISYGGVDYSHGWMIPLVSVAMLWHRRKELRAFEPRPSLWGLAFLVAAIFLHVVGLRVAQTRLSLIALIAMLWGAPFYLYGRRVAGTIIYPAAYLGFCIPLNFLNTLTFPLRLLASTVACWLLNGMNIGAVRSGSRIFSTSGQGFSFDVADPCSGLRSLLAIAALTAAYAFFTQKTLWRRLALCIAALPIAVAGNITRIVAVGIVANWVGQDVATGLYHDYSGYAIFVVSVIFMLGAERLINSVANLPRRSRLHSGEDHAVSEE